MSGGRDSSSSGTVGREKERGERNRIAELEAGGMGRGGYEEMCNKGVGARQ